MDDSWWSQRFHPRTKLMRRSAVRELLRVANQPGMISFAGGLPSPDLFPMAEIEEAARGVLRDSGTRAVQYGETEGLMPLREWIAGKYSTPSLQISPANILIVSGSQQALDLLGRIFLGEGQTVLVENPTYLAALSAWRPWGCAFKSLECDEDGLQPDSIPSPCPESARFLYTIPNFQNPQGTTLTEVRRRRLIERAHRERMIVIEDDPYGALRYSGQPQPSLLQLDAEGRKSTHANGHVVHLGTFSKILAPGLRVGWVIAPEEVIDTMVRAKQSMDLHTSTLNQEIALRLAQTGCVERQLPKLCAEYGRRRDTMLSAMEKHFPSGCRWTKPEGGMFLMAWLPDNLDATDCLKRAIEQKVAFVPGADFYIDGTGRNALRLNFSNATPERIEEGIRRLGAVLSAR